MSKRYSKHLPALIFICDLLLLNVALYRSHLVTLNSITQFGSYPIFLLIINMSWMLVSFVTKSFHLKRPLVLTDSINSFLLTLVYHLLMLFGIIYFFKIYDVSRYDVIMRYSAFFFLVICHRSLLFFSLDLYRKRGYNHRQVLIIGDEQIAARLQTSFSRHPEYGYDLIDFISDDHVSIMSESMLTDKILAAKPDEIFLCYKQLNPVLLKNLTSVGEENFIKIKVVSDLLLIENYAHLVNYDSLPVLHITQKPDIDFKIRFLKRSFDILFSTIVMILGLPAFIVLYITTKITSTGPAFYGQERIGLNGKPFYIYKFRSMYVNAEKFGPQLSKDNDPRITKWGYFMRQTRLDELPQFWNVLIGKMSVVGPRPERQHFIEMILEKKPDYKKLLRLKPGITSIGQVHYGYAENIDQMCTRVRYDMLYLQNISLNSDLDIIYKTVKVMVQRKGK